MANVLINEDSMTAIADAIRAKNGTQNTYKPAQMAEAISAISGGGITPTGTKQISITQNGTTTEDVSAYANAEITVNVSGGGSLTLNGISDLKFSGNAGSGNTQFVATVPLLTSLSADTSTTYESIEVATSQSAVILALTSTGTANQTLTSVKLGASTLLTIGSSGLRGFGALTTIEGLVKLISSSYVFVGTAAMVNVTFAENSTAVNIPLGTCSNLSNASAISAGNGADESVAKTFTLHSSVKANVASLTGNSVKVASGGTTYHRFVLDENGSMTFSNFITNVKGWTFA